MIRSAHKSRVQAVNPLHALVITAPPELWERLRGVTVRKLVTTCAGLRPRISDDLSTTSRPPETARRIVMLDEQVGQLTHDCASSSKPPHPRCSSSPASDWTVSQLY